MEGMARNLLLSAIVLFSLLICSCRRDGIDHNSLIGEWDWVRQTEASAINGPPYNTLTPANSGGTRMLSFYGDSTYSMVILSAPYLQRTETGNFKIKEVLSPNGGIKLLDFVHNGVDSLVNHTLNHDTLYISNTLFTGKYIVNVYRRIIPV